MYVTGNLSGTDAKGSSIASARHSLLQNSVVVHLCANEGGPMALVPFFGQVTNFGQWAVAFVRIMT
jgi:hypothetical protein